MHTCYKGYVGVPQVFLLSASAAQVDPGLSKRCVRRAHGLNLTQFQARQGFGAHTNLFQVQWKFVDPLNSFGRSTDLTASSFSALEVLSTKHFQQGQRPEVC